jgi:hypothetical protein
LSDFSAIKVATVGKYVAGSAVVDEWGGAEHVARGAQQFLGPGVPAVDVGLQGGVKVDRA